MFPASANSKRAAACALFLNTYDKNDEVNQFLLNMAKNYVKVLDKDCKNKCIEILTALK